MSNDFTSMLGGYRIEDEDREGLVATSTPAQMMMMGQLPDVVDPRRHEKFGQGFMRMENQAAIGSCAGSALSEHGEFCYMIGTGRVIQFSKMYSYITTQIHDRINGDKGSTIYGGSKSALQDGFCPESEAPYPDSYPGHEYVTPQMRQSASRFKLKTHTVLKDVDSVLGFIGSGMGIVQIGIAWGDEMSKPDRHGCVREFKGRGQGGHSINFAGYVTDDDVGQRSSTGKWILGKNTWTEKWNPIARGWVYIDPQAVDQMFQHRFTVMIGRSDMSSPKPRPLPVDFTGEKGSMYQ